LKKPLWGTKLTLLGGSGNDSLPAGDIKGEKGTGPVLGGEVGLFRNRESGYLGEN